MDAPTQPVYFRRRQINAMRAAQAQSAGSTVQASADEKTDKVGRSGACPKCGRRFANGLNLHARKCKG